jgi:putative transposase
MARPVSSTCPLEVEFAGSDDHAELKAAIREVLPAWQRCYVHFLGNALDYVPRKVDDDCHRRLCWFYDRRALSEVRRDIAAWFLKWQAKYQKLCAWAEENIDTQLSADRRAGSVFHGTMMSIER